MDTWYTYTNYPSVTPQEVLVKLFPPLDAARKQKTIALCTRQRIDLQAVLALLTPEQRQQWEAV